MLTLAGLFLWSCTVAAFFGSTGGFMCPTLFDFYPDPEDCSKFYRCFWGAGYQFDCPEGTLWNHKVLTCDFSFNVDCEDGYWGSEAHYLEEHREDHTHDYDYDTDHDSDNTPTADSNDADSGGGWDRSGRPRDDSAHWGDYNSGPEEEQVEVTGEGVGGSEPADSEGIGGGSDHLDYNTGAPILNGFLDSDKKPHRHSDGHGDHVHVKVKSRNTSGSGKTPNPSTTTATTTTTLATTTTVSPEDKLLIDHLEKLDPAPDKPDRIGAIGSFQEQKTADRSRDTNVDYVYANDKDEKAKTHGRYGYYGFPGVQRSGYYAPPSQRLPFFWPFEKRR